MPQSLHDSLTNLRRANASLHASLDFTPRDRNLTVHTYDEAFALQMAERIEKQYTALFDVFLSRLEQEVATT
ncbi:MAG: Nucleotidyltransferase substrate binding protein like [Pseudomonadota bacterium]|jgi:hypothetical protein